MDASPILVSIRNAWPNPAKTNAPGRPHGRFDSMTRPLTLAVEPEPTATGAEIRSLKCGGFDSNEHDHVACFDMVAAHSSNGNRRFDRRVWRNRGRCFWFMVYLAKGTTIGRGGLGRRSEGIYGSYGMVSNPRIYITGL
jgi:hypothetical protein